VKLSDFDYNLPPDLIAQQPAEPRDASRLLVVDRAQGTIEHRTFRNLPEHLRPGDVVVVNDSRVINARLQARWEDTGGQVEFLLLHETDGGAWEALARPGRRVRAGRRAVLAGGGVIEVLASPRDGVALIGLPAGLDLEQAGELPLPPYIHEQPADAGRYQTVYAATPGSVAAPTAGLHFTPELLDRLRAGSVEVVSLTLHVGIGTFRPVDVDDPREHTLHAEYGRVSAGAAGRVLAARAAGGRILAVGTTSVRLLEQWAAAGMSPDGWAGWTGFYILPGHQFRAVDALITNFHLPRTTLLMLVSAFAGDDLRRKAYEVAIAERYRFYSFGDAMLIV